MLDMPSASSKIRISFLETLPVEERKLLRRSLARVRLINGQVLTERGAATEQVHFIETGMISVVTGVRNDELGVEVGMIGREGLTGVAAVFDEHPISFFRTQVQMPGIALRIPAGHLRALAADMPVLRRRSFRYVQALMTQSRQCAKCNLRHALPERLARWLLAAHDRAEGDEMLLMQEALSQMLGVRRSGVTIAFTALEKAGLLRVGRGRVRVLNRAGLEAASCECYRLVRDEFDRLLGVEDQGIAARMSWPCRVSPGSHSAASAGATASGMGNRVRHSPG